PRRVPLPQRTGDLLGRPVFPKTSGDVTTQHRVPGELAPLRASGSTPCTIVGVNSAVAARPLVLSDLATDRRGGPAEPATDRPIRLTRREATRYLLALDQGQRPRPAALRRLIEPTERQQDREDRPGRRPDRSGYLADRRTRLPQLPYLLSPI